MRTRRSDHHRSRQHLLLYRLRKPHRDGFRTPRAADRDARRTCRADGTCGRSRDDQRDGAGREDRRLAGFGGRGMETLARRTPDAGAAAQGRVREPLQSPRLHPFPGRLRRGCGDHRRTGDADAADQVAVRNRRPAQGRRSRRRDDVRLPFGDCRRCSGIRGVAGRNRGRNPQGGRVAGGGGGARRRSRGSSRANRWRSVSAG